MHRFLILASLALIGFQIAPAQNPFEGKDIAVYFSKKYFTFPEEYRFMVPAFILSDQGKDVPLEDLRQQTLISLGGLLAAQLDSVSGANRTWFLNEDPSKANVFLQHYLADSNLMMPMAPLFKDVDGVLIINPLSLSGYKRKIVYVRSDKVISEYEYVMTAKVSFTLVNPQNGNRLGSTTVCFDAFRDRVDQPKFDFRSRKSPLGKFLSEVFTLGLLQLQEGIRSTCE